MSRVVQDGWEAALQLPRGEEERPVDVGHELGEIDVHLACAGERRRRRLREIQLQPVGSRLLYDTVGRSVRVAYCSRSLAWSTRLALREPFVCPALSRLETTSMTRDASGTWTVGLLVVRRDLHGRMLPAGGRSADQQRQLHAAALHLGGHVRHFVQRRRDQAAQPDDVHLALDGRVEDLVGRHHHAEIDHLVAVAAQHHADDVLADVVDVALDRGQQDPALRAGAAPARPSRPP